LRLRLDDGGRVATVAIERSSGFKVLDEAAMAAARRSRFRLREPIRSPATSWGRLRYRFEIGSG
jgi:TonB family protein